MGLQERGIGSVNFAVTFHYDQPVS
jgi:hypothetical protein